MKTYYCANGYNAITPVNVVKETEHYLTIEGRFGNHYRVRRTSTLETHHETWEAAKAFLLNRTEANIRAATEHLDSLRLRLAKINAMTHPEGGK